MKGNIAAALAASVCIIALATPAAAQQREFNIPAGSLKAALDAYGRQSGRPIIYKADEVRNARTSGYRGKASPQEALDTILSNSGFVARSDNSGAVAIVREGNGQGIPGKVSSSDELGTGIAAADNETADIVVTGSRIVGSPIASPLIVRSGKQLQEQGYTNLADAVRGIPQNFGGSQNPSAGMNVPESNGTYLGASSSIDLRGIGGDATLTLLNGHRLSYNGAYQAIDISTIPLAALDRIEIVSDGSSALYGSDAVAGVANIILKPDMDGLTASTRLGGATDGGDFQQQYDLAAGRRWANGGFLVALDHSRSSPITANQRSYASTIAPGLTLQPAVRQNTIIGSGHQSFGSVKFSIDGFYNNRRSDRYYEVIYSDDLAGNRGMQSFRSSSYSLSPRVDIKIGSGWTTTLQGSYSKDSSRYLTYYYYQGVENQPTAGCYCNRELAAEAGATGPLFSMPGGDVKLALGGGYRRAGYHGYRTRGAAQDINVSQSTYFAYGELNAPFVSSSNERPLLRKLDLSIAMRYEDYPGVSKVVTPKIGAIYAPSTSIDIKGSWGRSFKAPTFYERYSEQAVEALDIGELGGAGYPQGTVGLDLYGGNPDLKPERASTWTATVAVHPLTLSGFYGEISYFHIDYRNRIVDPITYFSTVLNTPSLAQYVTLDPSPQEIASTIDGRQFYDFTSLGYDSSKVGAILDERSVNAARQKVSGVDASLRYRWHLSPRDSLETAGDATYLHSREQLSLNQPLQTLAGTLFNPPHFRARGGLTWQRDRTTITTFLNYASPVRDTRNSPDVTIRGMTTWDAAANWKIRLHTGPKELDLSLTVTNILNQKPALITTSLPYETPYDHLTVRRSGGSRVARCLSRGKVLGAFILAPHFSAG